MSKPTTGSELLEAIEAGLTRGEWAEARPEDGPPGLSPLRDVLGPIGGGLVEGDGATGDRKVDAALKNASSSIQKLSAALEGWRKTVATKKDELPEDERSKLHGLSRRSERHMDVISWELKRMTRDLKGGR